MSLRDISRYQKDGNDFHGLREKCVALVNRFVIHSLAAACLDANVISLYGREFRLVTNHHLYVTRYLYVVYHVACVIDGFFTHMNIRNT